MNYLNNGGTLLVEFILGTYAFLLLIRFWMHWTNANFRSPLGHFLIQISNPVLLPFRNVISTNRGFAYAVLTVAIILIAIKTWLLFVLKGIQPQPAGLIVYAIAETLKLSVHIFLGAMIIRIISSWIMSPGMQNPIVNITYSLTEPLMAPARRIIPPMGGIDLSPIIVFLFLQLSLAIIVAPVYDLAKSML